MNVSAHHVFQYTLLIGLTLLVGCYDESYAPNVNDQGIPGQGEQYEDYGENPFVIVAEEPVSTFSIDADGGSYSNIRRFLNDGELPPLGAIRIEEMINYFEYDYPEPTGGLPFALEGEVSACPWTPAHKLIRIGMKGKEIPYADLPPSNFVFLIDVS
ncbi:MAG: von Willebrand factor type A domain-containing protein, partial [Phaeodactylibacter sp.]|nr:von Willebrand factor type A domain-containing protein [Phaeodactylibacter sp.]